MICSSIRNPYKYLADEPMEMHSVLLRKITVSGFCWMLVRFFDNFAETTNLSGKCFMSSLAVVKIKCQISTLSSSNDFVCNKTSINGNWVTIWIPSNQFRRWNCVQSLIDWLLLFFLSIQAGRVGDTSPFVVMHPKTQSVRGLPLKRHQHPTSLKLRKRTPNMVRFM